jgi:hypothetical protein
MPVGDIFDERAALSLHRHRSHALATWEFVLTNFAGRQLRETVAITGNF